MNRKTITILTVLLFLVIGAIIFGYFYLSNTNIDGTPKNGGTGSLAPNQNLIVDSETEGLVGSSTEGKPPRFRQISKTPVAGFDFVETSSGYNVWYVERANGNIFQTSTSSRETVRITNTTIPKVYEAFIAKNGAQVALRTLDETTGNIQTFVASPKTKTGTSSADQTKELVGSYAPNNIRNMTVSPSKSSLFGILNGVLGGEGIIYPFSGVSSIVFSHTIRNWVPEWVNSTTISMTTAPSARTQNLAYLFNTTTKALTKIAGPKNGLVVSVSPNLAYSLLSENKNNLLSFSLLNIKTQQETVLSRQTVADKCVWSSKNNDVAYCGLPKTVPSGVYPDSWYQGKVLFDDVIGKVDASNGEVREIFNPQDFGVQADMINPTLSPDEKYILFSNKRDLTLWMYEL